MIFIASKSDSIYSNFDMSVLFDEAIKLPDADRRKLAYDLLETLDDPEEEFYLSPEQAAELDRRIEHNRLHPDDVVAWEDVLKRWRQRV